MQIRDHKTAKKGSAQINLTHELKEHIEFYMYDILSYVLL